MSTKATEHLSNSYFLQLLSAAIWDRPLDETLFEGLDKSLWREIASMAYRQSVSALVGDKAVSLPAEFLPPGDITMRFISVIEQTRQTNLKMIGVLKELKKEYTREGFPFLLLKGLANGVNYPEPLLRNPGDIDLLLYNKGDYDRLYRWLTQNGVDIQPEGDLHFSFSRNGIHVENHYRTTYFTNRWYSRRFVRLERDILNKGEFPTAEVDSDLSVSVLPVTFNAFFLFQHLFRHFVSSGIGLRHVCDWILFLHKHRKDIDGDEFTRLARRFALLYPMQLFARVAVDYLGAPESIFPFPMTSNKRHADKVIYDILDSGNFGFHRSGKKRPKEKMARMWSSYVNAIKRTLKFGSISLQHFAIIPFTALISRLKKGLKD